jgi:hypothetical protein
MSELVAFANNLVSNDDNAFMREPEPGGSIQAQRRRRWSVSSARARMGFGAAPQD